MLICPLHAAQCHNLELALRHAEPKYDDLLCKRAAGVMYHHAEPCGEHLEELPIGVAGAALDNLVFSPDRLQKTGNIPVTTARGAWHRSLVENFVH